MYSISWQYSWVMLVGELSSHNARTTRRQRSSRHSAERDDGAIWWSINQTRLLSEVCSRQRSPESSILSPR